MTLTHTKELEKDYRPRLWDGNRDNDRLKKSKKTPKGEIERAESYRREYLKRRGKA